jgi:hypothetical protein
LRSKFHESDADADTWPLLAELELSERESVAEAELPLALAEETLALLSLFLVLGVERAR